MITERSANPGTRAARRHRGLLTMRPRWTVAWLFLMGLVRPCSGQTIEARRWSHLPIGSQIISAGYAETTGDIFLNPVLRIEDAEFELDTLAVKYIRSFELGGKSARVELFQAWQSGDWRGLLDGVPASAARDGWADTSVRLAVNLLGAPPLTGKEFAAYRAKTHRETILGVGLDMDLPTGEYMDDKLINLGSNCFTFTPQVGVVHNRDKWSMELTASTLFYTDNDSFFNGRRLEQDPLLFLQGHVIYNIRPGVWLAASAGYGCGAESTIDGVSANDRKEFVAWGLAFGIPLNRHAGLKFGYIGTRTLADTGADTGTFIAGAAWMW